MQILLCNCCLKYFKRYLFVIHFTRDVTSVSSHAGTSISSLCPLDEFLQGSVEPFLQKAILLSSRVKYIPFRAPQKSQISFSMWASLTCEPPKRQSLYLMYLTKTYVKGGRNGGREGGRQEDSKARSGHVSTKIIG